MLRPASLLVAFACLFACARVSAEPQGRASASLSVTATVQPSCAIHVGGGASATAPPAVLRCHPQDTARAIVTIVTMPAATTSSTDAATRLVTIQF